MFVSRSIRLTVLIGFCLCLTSGLNAAMPDHLQDRLDDLTIDNWSQVLPDVLETLRGVQDDVGLALADSLVIMAEERGDSVYYHYARCWQGLFICEIRRDTSALGPIRQARTFGHLHQQEALVAICELNLSRVFHTVGNLNAAARAAQVAGELLDSLQQTELAAQAFNTLGLIEWGRGRMAQSERAYQRVIELEKQLSRGKLKAYLHNNLAVLYYQWGRFDEALDHYHIALDLFHQIDAPSSVALIQANMGELYHALGQDSLARVMLETAAEYGERNQEPKVIANARNWLGFLALEGGDYEEALLHFQYFLEFQRANRDQVGIARGWRQIGQAELARSDFDEAARSFQRSLEHALAVGSLLEEGRARNFLGTSLIYSGQIAAGMKELQLARKLAEENHYHTLLLDVHKALAHRHFIGGNIRAAQHHARIAVHLEDSLRNALEMSKLHQLQVRYDLEQKEQLIEDLNHEQELQALQLARERSIRTWGIVGFICLILILILVVTLWYSQYRGRQREKAYRKELSALNEELAQRLEERNRFFRILAHDLRGPLGGIQGMLDIMVDGPAIDDEERQKVFLSMRQSAKSLYTLLENLLTWSRLQTEDLKPDPKWVSGFEMAADVVNLLRLRSDEKGVRIETDIPVELGLLIDPQALQIILRNLLSNAVKFSAPGSVVHLHMERLEGNEGTLITVRDHGIGIPAEARETLFDSSKVLRRSGTAGERSTGLGLALVKEFVEQNEGVIQVNSIEGEGTTFSIVFPQTGA